MARVFDTAISGADKAPPKGSWRVCVEGPSGKEPTDPKHKSYRLIGDWSDAQSAIAHAKSAQETYNEAAEKAGNAAPVIVAFGCDASELYRGKPYVAPARVEPAKVEPAKVEPAKVKPAKVAADNAAAA